MARRCRRQAARGAHAFRLPSRQGQQRIQPPPPLSGKAPRDWPGAKPAIAVVDFGPGLVPFQLNDFRAKSGKLDNLAMFSVLVEDRAKLNYWKRH